MSLNSQQNNSVLKNNHYSSKTILIVWTTENFENINFISAKLIFYFSFLKWQITSED